MSGVRAASALAGCARSSRGLEAGEAGAYAQGDLLLWAGAIGVRGEVPAHTHPPGGRAGLNADLKFRVHGT